ATRADEAAPPPGVKGEMLNMIKAAEDELVQLSDAMPESKYSWRPGKGVRSVGEVYLHVAGANYGIPSLFGVKPPEGFDIKTYEKSMTKKDDIRKALMDSFAHMEGAFMSMSDEDMEKQADVFGTQMTARGAYLLLLSHAHEHLGQSIAYARMNAIVPPWTAKRQAAMKQSQEKPAAAR
ncbi:MAG: DinB family protein, partial [Deltaproteobacteria bacterium]